MSTFEFPIELRLRVIGRQAGQDAPDLLGLVFETAARHIPDLTLAQLAARPSSASNYASIVVSFTALDRDQLEALTRDLQSLPQVILVL